MDNRDLELLELKYWAGETTLPEEEVLQRAARAGSEGLSADYKRLVGLADQSREAELDPAFEAEFWARVEGGKSSGARIFTIAHFIRYAAVGIVLVALGLGMWDIISEDHLPATTKPVWEGQLISAVEDTYESPEQAFEEAKKALLFASQKLNKGAAPVEEIKRFHTTKMSIIGQGAENQ